MEQQSQLERLGLFDARACRAIPVIPRPRISSPPSPRRISATGGGDLDRRGDLALHACALCRRLCWFCACRAQGTQSDDPVRAYAEVLLADLPCCKALAPGVRLSRLHWRRHADLDAGRNDAPRRRRRPTPFHWPRARSSVEIDPNEIDDARMDALAESGLTRASIGVQDFDPEIQKVIGREQSFEVTKRAVDMIRDRGIASLNADILYGLPHRDPRRIAESVQKLLALSPRPGGTLRLCACAMDGQAAGDDPLGGAARPGMAVCACSRPRANFSLADGYDEIGIDHFARPGDGLARAQRRRAPAQFPGYTDDRAEVLIGLGASSISRFPQGYAQNAPATGAHTAAIRDGRFSITRGHAFSAEDIWRARMIEALMCDFEIRADEFTATTALTKAALPRSSPRHLRASATWSNAMRRACASRCAAGR